MIEAEKGIDLFGFELKAPTSSQDIVLGVLMVITLIVRPTGLTRGREFALGDRAKPSA